MRMMGLESVAPKPNTSGQRKGHKCLSLSAEKDVDHRTRSGVVFRYHLHSAGSRLCLSDSSNGLGQPLCVVLGSLSDPG